MEHRWGRRLVTRIPVLVRTRSRDRKVGLLTNVSVSGAFIQTEPLGEEVSCVELEIDAERFSAYVVRETDTGFAVEWSEFAAERICLLVWDAETQMGTMLSLLSFGAQSRR